jgi:dynein heavy chain
MWAAKAYPSLKPLATWVPDLVTRTAFIQSWYDTGKPPVFWISGFFFPQAFITGVMQNHARKYQLPIDTVGFDYGVLKPDEMKAAEEVKYADGSVCWGLFIEGARFDTDSHVVCESRPRELFTVMPYITLSPKVKTDIEAAIGSAQLYTGSIDGTAHVYMCPIYKTSVRMGVLSTTGHSTNFVMYIKLPMAKGDTQRHWIKRGVACLTGLDD